MVSVKQFVFNPLQENTYVIYNEGGECCIVDPGCYFTSERNELKDFIHDSGLVPKYLLNTHCHLDHVFGNQFVTDTWKLKLHIHTYEKLVLEFAPAMGEKWGLPLDEYRGEIEFLEPGKEIVLGKDRFLILFTPGHSPGSVCFYHQEQKIVIGGDVLFRQSIGRSDLPGGDFKTLLTSIIKELFTPAR